MPALTLYPAMLQKMFAISALKLNEEECRQWCKKQYILWFSGDTLALSKSQIAPVAHSNSVEKPVQEASEPAPQRVTGTAVIPLQPPPAVPVNAAAANVPTNNGAVFLGSGALGVINLGNGELLDYH